MLFAELRTQLMLRSKRLSEAKGLSCFRLPDPDRVQAATVALFRPSTIVTATSPQSTHLKVWCSKLGRTGVISVSIINAWHCGHIRPLIFADLTKVRSCDILLPLFERERDTLSVTGENPIRAAIR
jgi:hypothetical protein